ncbi:MAG: acyltransferase domain-containing protein, partial [Okeania sp. SIO4D6]|nr:acyltransferase domain-containing protein [Okeania sp. SIO4D6]
EIVAATVAGVWSLEDGLKLIAARGRLMQNLPSGGEMVSLMASESVVSQYITPESEVAIAAINGPESTVISGASIAIKGIVNQLEAKGIKTKQLEVSHAFHSPLMEPMLSEFEAVANQLTYNQPQIPIISNVTGTIADESIASANYWVNHIRQPVRFAQGIETLNQQGAEIFLEIGPKPILLGMGRECLMGSKKLWLPSLRLGKPDWLQMLQSLGELYIRSIQIDWLGFYKDYSCNKVELPTYPWQRKSYWIKNIPNNKLSKSLSEPQLLKTQTQRNRERGQKVKIELLNLDSMSVAKSSPTSFVKQQTNTEISDFQQTNTEVSNFQPLVTRQNLDFNEIKETLKQKLADAMYLEPSEIIENKKFIDLGLDSIVGVEWINSINKHYGLNIKVTKVYNYPTILKLAEYIKQEIDSDNSTAVPVKQELPKNPVADSLTQNMDSSSELQESLMQELDSILEWVAKKELSTKVANQMIEKLKQKARAN